MGTTIYKLTDKHLRTHQGYQWVVGTGGPMPEVKWVMNSQLFASDLNEGLEKPLFVPVLTLDALEAWLKEQRTRQLKYTDDYRPVFDDLLAQVPKITRRQRRRSKTC